MLHSLMRDTVTVKTYSDGGPTAFDAVDAYSTGTDTQAFVEQIAQTENLGGRDTRVTRFLVLVPADVNINALDRVVYNTLECRVTAEPAIRDGFHGAALKEFEIEVISG